MKPAIAARTNIPYLNCLKSMIRSIAPYAILKPLFNAAILVVMLNACSDDTDPRLEEESFSRIYDNSLFNLSVDPIDIQQTADGGYLILSDRELYTEQGEEEDYAGIYLLKVDSKGNFVRDIEVEDTYVHPIGQLMEDQGSFYFFCMDINNVGVNLVKVDANAEGIEFIPVGGYAYPMAASKDAGAGNFILLSYNPGDKMSVLSVITPAGSVGASASMPIGVGDNENVEDLIIKHFTRTGKHFPFLAGHIPGSVYYFNGFVDYSLTLAFVNFGSDDPIVGRMNGNQENAGINALVHIASTKYALAWFNFSENHLLPGTPLNPSAPSENVVSLPGYELPELTPYANVKIMRTTIGEQNMLVYGSDTRAKQIGLYFYDEATGEFKGAKYLGFSNPFEIAGMVTTADGGLAVCGTTYIVGRFPRICLFKLSKEDLKESIK